MPDRYFLNIFYGIGGGKFSTRKYALYLIDLFVGFV